MKRILFIALLMAPLFSKAQKIDEQKLKTQLKMLAKSAQKHFTDLQGKIKKIERGDTTYYSKFKLEYSVDTLNTITAGNYAIVFNSRYPDVINVIDKIIRTTDLGFGKMEPGGGREGLNIYGSKPKKVNNIMQFLGMTVDLDRNTLYIQGPF